MGRKLNEIIFLCGINTQDSGLWMLHPYFTPLRSLQLGFGHNPGCTGLLELRCGDSDNSFVGQRINHRKSTHIWARDDITARG